MADIKFCGECGQIVPRVRRCTCTHLLTAHLWDKPKPSCTSSGCPCRAYEEDTAA